MYNFEDECNEWKDEAMSEERLITIWLTFHIFVFDYFSHVWAIFNISCKYNNYRTMLYDLIFRNSERKIVSIYIFLKNNNVQ